MQGRSLSQLRYIIGLTVMPIHMTSAKFDLVNYKTAVRLYQLFIKEIPTLLLEITKSVSSEIVNHHLICYESGLVPPFDIHS